MTINITATQVGIIICLILYMMIARWFQRTFVYEGNMTPGRAWLEAIIWPIVILRLLWALIVGIFQHFTRKR